MNGFSRVFAAAIAATAVTAAMATAALPASAAQMRPDCASDRNLMQVHRRLDGAIDQLSHDQRDYGGRRVAAINDLQNARRELIAAEAYARNDDRDNPRCFTTSVRPGGSDFNWGDRGQRGSNANLLAVRSWVERMMDSLQRDERDYGGHRIAAVGDMQKARNELVAAERFR